MFFFLKTFDEDDEWAMKAALHELKGLRSVQEIGKPLWVPFTTNFKQGKEGELEILPFPDQGLFIPFMVNRDPFLRILLMKLSFKRLSSTSWDTELLLCRVFRCLQRL